MKKREQEKPKGTKDERIAYYLSALTTNIGKLEGIQHGLRGRNFIFGENKIYNICNSMHYCV